MPVAPARQQGQWQPWGTLGHDSCLGLVLADRSLVLGWQTLLWILYLGWFLCLLAQSGGALQTPTKN